MMAWHYTIGQRFLPIMESGLLMPTKIGVTPPERPIVWFSMHQEFEPTARKWDATGRVMDVLEMIRVGRGLVRFGSEPKRLLAGEALRKKARMLPRVWTGLAARGIAQGANPDDWCGTVVPVLVDRLVIEVTDADFKWVRVGNDSDED